MTAKQADKREPLDLAPIKARASEASDGPWSWWNVKDRSDTGEKERWVIVEGGCGNSGWHLQWLLGDDNPTFKDADFIANARDDIPALVDEVEKLRKENDELRRKLKKGRDAAEAIFKAHTP